MSDENPGNRTVILTFFVPLDFESRKHEITRELMEAAETVGFLSLVDHGITVDEINAQFELSRNFFSLPHEIKGQIPHSIEDNNGWEYKVSKCSLIISISKDSDVKAFNQSQIRPSTGQADQKESFWMQHNSQWPSDEHVPGFSTGVRNFMDKCRGISEKVRKLV